MPPAGAAETGLVEQRQEKVRVETTRYRITGEVTLARDGYRSRLSDLLNAQEREFIALTDVTAVPHDGGEPERFAFLALARAHIVFASSEENGSGGRP